jgi:hypothetical protein
MKSYIFWDIMSCSPLRINRHFGGTCHLYLQGRRISQARNQATSFHAGFLLGLFFDPEDGGDMFFRNVGWLSANCTALCPRRQNSRMRVFENRVLRRIFWRKRDEMTTGWREIHNLEPHHFYYLPYIIEMFKSRTRWTGHVADMGQMKN